MNKRGTIHRANWKINISDTGKPNSYQAKRRTEATIRIQVDAFPPTHYIGLGVYETKRHINYVRGTHVRIKEYAKNLIITVDASLLARNNIPSETQTLARKEEI